jgi:Cu(I)/Ag(I) efflux system membrane protein CusA/SilA
MSNVHQKPSLIDAVIRFCLENKLVVALLLIFIIVWGILVAPFDWRLGGISRDPIPVDAIPDIGENQQIVFTEWAGRSPQDIEDQITYPLTVSLMGIPGVKTIRSYSMFGFSTIYIIFKDNIDFYWSRSRVLEKLNSLASGLLPFGVQPMLGPDATALGQVFWYTLEGLDQQRNPTGGWDLQELRTIQDWYVRYSLLATEGVSEVASIGGFVQEYQIDVDPNAMLAAKVSLQEVVEAVKMSNLDVGASSIEVNQVEYIIRGIGFVKKVSDLENAVVKVNENVPIYIKNIAHVVTGPAFRAGALDKAGTEVVGGVVVVRYSENPLQMIQNLKSKIQEISQGLPSKILPDGTKSQIHIVPFYDRSGLIYETLNTLNIAIYQEILVTIIVILVMLMHLRSSILISGLLPVAVLMTFIAMKLFKVDSNIVSLSGIAIAIGTMVDMGIIINENILHHLEEAPPDESKLEVVFRASSEVGGAILTAVATTVVSFLPVFSMQAAEGKLFKPLAFTKTFALIASVVVSLTIIPSFAQILFTRKINNRIIRKGINILLIVLGILAFFLVKWWIGIILLFAAAYQFFSPRLAETRQKWLPWIINGFAILVVVTLLASDWLPMGPDKGILLNLFFVGGLIAIFLLFFKLFRKYYELILSWALSHKTLFLSIPGALLVLGLFIWLGFNTFLGWLPLPIRSFAPVSYLAHKFPGMGKEFMPQLDEGSFLFMPTTMPHASIGEALDILKKQDMAINSIPEVSMAVGKLGRADSPLDPAPISMFETIINYHPQYLEDTAGNLLAYRFDPDSIDFFRTPEGQPVSAADGQPYLVKGAFIRDQDYKLIPQTTGHPFRLWRPAIDTNLNKGRSPWKGIQSSQDIWDKIIEAAEMPGTTSAPMLQPIAARIVMLQSGMRAPMGVKIKGPDLPTIEKMGMKIEHYLKEVPSIDATTVIADRIIGKPYLEIEIDRQAIARYGIMINQIQEIIEVAIGGKQLTTTVEGRERYAVRVRYLRELRDNIESLGKIFVPAANGSQIPLEQLAAIRYVRGADMIKSEDSFLIGYVIFDMIPGQAEVEVVEQAQNYLKQKITSGELQLPAGITYIFAGSYENQIRAQRRLYIILPLALFIIFMILYFQFRNIPVTLLVFSGIAVAWAGGFIMLWFYSQSWFLDFSIFSVNLRELFHIRPFNLSVAVWVGFLALFGIATDDGVLIATYLKQSFQKFEPDSVESIRQATVVAGKRRVRPALMTTATTVLALIPVITATGRGADIMVPMAIPSFGGMIIAMITMLVVPVLYSAMKESRLKSKDRE